MQKLIFISFFTIFASVANADISLRFNKDAEIENLKSSEKRRIISTESIHISKEDPYIVRMNDMLPMLLVPISNANANVEVRGLPIQDIVEINSQKMADQVLSGLLSDIVQIQSLVRRNEIQRAADSLSQVEKKYPNITSLKFIKASIFFLQGKKNEARTLLQEALKAHPDNEEGQKFLKEIKDSE